MSSSLRSSRDGSLSARAAPEEVTVVDWPLRDQPIGSSVAMSVAAGLSWLAIWATDVPAAGAIIGTALFITLWRTWLPVTYHLGSSGIVQSVLGWRRRIPWSAVRRYEQRGNGVVLLPSESDSVYASLRGCYLHWGEQRDAVLSQVEYHVVPRSRAPTGSTQTHAAVTPSTPRSL
jgi:hypothetical protein